MTWPIPNWSNFFFHIIQSGLQHHPASIQLRSEVKAEDTDEESPAADQGHSSWHIGSSIGQS